MAGTPEKVFFEDFEIAINTGTDELPVWTDAANVKTLAFSPSMRETDLTDWSSEGWDEHAVMGRGGSWSVTCHRMEATDDGTRDAFQAAVEALGQLTGAGSKKGFKLTSPGGEEWTFKASANVNPFAGSGNQGDAAEWTAELKMSGKPTIV